VKIKSEFKSLKDPLLCAGAVRCLLWRILLIPYLILAVPFFCLGLVADGFTFAVEKAEYLFNPVQRIYARIEAEYVIATRLKGNE
jgi:hypothetical protein